MFTILPHASTGPSAVAVVSSFSTIRMAFTVVGLPISVPLGVASTVSTCVGGILLLTSKKLLKCYEIKNEFISYL